MIRRIFATAALGGTLALGGATAAWAAPTTTAPSHFNCAKASKALSHIDKVESKDQAFVVKATSREAAATKAKHPKAAKAHSEAHNRSTEARGAGHHSDATDRGCLPRLDGHTLVDHDRLTSPPCSLDLADLSRPLCEVG